VFCDRKLFELHRLDAAALICNTINSDQFSKAQSLILAIHKVLTVEEPLVNKRVLVRI